MKKGKKKFLEGGTIHNYVEDPMKAIYNNNLMIDQAIIQAAQETEGLKMLGSGLIGLGSQLPGAVGGFKKAFGKAEMKTGGKVPVEIEGQEVVETPQGQLFKVQGPSHEKGGIDMSLPEGTDVYSKRIQIDGKSMADRKLTREKNEKKWKKRSKYDSIAKNTLNRVKAKNQIEEMLDMSIMQAAFNAKNDGGQERQIGAEGIVGLAPKKAYLETSQYEEDKLKNQTITLNPRTGLYEGTDRISNEPLKKMPLVEYPKSAGRIFDLKGAADFAMYDIARDPMGLGNAKSENSGANSPEETSSQFPLTSGDILGMFGNAYQAYVNKASANAEIATDQPNINPYEGFGEDALNANSESMKYVGQIRDNALKDAALEANSAQKRGRGMSRSANTARAMDIAVSGNKNIANSKIQDAFAQQMMHLFDVKAQMENQQDMYTMKGKADQDAANRADKAARFATLRDADMSIGKAISGIGANLNTAKSREATSKLIDSMSMYGKYNWKTGELSFDTGGVDRMVEDGTWKKTVNAAGKSPTTVEEFREMAKSGKLKVKS